MLHEFITMHRADIIAKSREKLTARPWPTATTQVLHNGVPLFLEQLAETLKDEALGSGFSSTSIDATAALHGRELLSLGFTVSQVVHDYGDICQAVTELAIELQAPITTEEFHTLNRCLDAAIAGAVTEHERVTTESRSLEELERSGLLAHETRDLLNTALLAFELLKRGTVAINGSTASMLARSLTDMRDLVDSTLVDIRIAAKNQKRELIPLESFVNDLAATSGLQAEMRGVTLELEPVVGALTMLADQQMLRSAAMNLLSNAFKFTRPAGRVILRACRRANNAVIEVEDECGGIPASKGDPFQAFGEQRGSDRSGLGLGLFIARKAVRAHGGDIYIRNLPGKGCVFSIEIPLAVPEAEPALV